MLGDGKARLIERGIPSSVVYREGKPVVLLGPYADKAAALAQKVTAAGQRNWSALFTRMCNHYHNDNPDLPTLDPWVLTTRPPSSTRMRRES